jgi:hypothetical protein
MLRTTIVPWVHRRWVRDLGAMLLLGFVTWPLIWGGAPARAGTESDLQVSPVSYDFGRVKRLGGLVQTTFTLRARGETPLVLRRIWTS